MLFCLRTVCQTDKFIIFDMTEQRKPLSRKFLRRSFLTVSRSFPIHMFTSFPIFLSLCLYPHTLASSLPLFFSLSPGTLFPIYVSPLLLISLSLSLPSPLSLFISFPSFLCLFTPPPPFLSFCRTSPNISPPDLSLFLPRHKLGYSLGPFRPVLNIHVCSRGRLL